MKLTNKQLIEQLQDRLDNSNRSRAAAISLAMRKQVRAEKAEAERDEMAKSLNSTDGNIWRYWSAKARDFAFEIKDLSNRVARAEAKRDEAMVAIKSLKFKWHMRDLQTSDFDNALASIKEGKL